MAQYIDHLPKSATLESAFLDLHQKADRTANKVERSSDHTGLTFDSYYGYQYLGYSTLYKSVGVRIDDEKYDLFGISILEGHRSGRPASTTHPRHIEAFRGGERIADYRLTQEGFQGNISFRLGWKGMVDKEIPEPIGRSEFVPPHPVKQLDTSELYRLRLVTQGVFRAITAAEAILHGAEPTDIMSLLDRSVEVSPEKRLVSSQAQA